MIIEHRLEIAAPAERVWSVITDLERYPEWNPFVVGCRSTLEVGDAIDMKVRVFPSFAQPQREWIHEHEPGRRFSYGLRGRMLASQRSHEVEALDGGRCRYVSHFELRGWLSPLVRTLLGGRLQAGFDAMSHAIQARAESL